MPGIIIIDHELRRLREPRRSLRPRGANLPEYSLPRELISVVIIVSPRPRLGAIASEFSEVTMGSVEVSGAQMFARPSTGDDGLPAFSARITLSCSGMPCLRDGTLRYFYLLTNEIFNFSWPEVRGCRLFRRNNICKSYLQNSPVQVTVKIILDDNI